MDRMHNRLTERLLRVSLVSATVLFSFSIVVSNTRAQESLTLSQSDELECFIEPYRSVEVPAGEIGILAEIMVEEGDVVSEKQLLARLDDDILRRSLEVARTAMNAAGPLRAAMAELDGKARQLKSYESLRREANATEREIQRATTAMVLAEAKVQSVREDLEVRRLEFERTKAQLRKRQIEAPLSGTVVLVEKEAGEYISPTDPVVLTIVDLSTLKAVFSVPQHVSISLKAGDSVELRLGVNESRVPGLIEFVSPTTDPQSGTVRVKIRIENRDRSLVCGSLCRWDGSSFKKATRVTQYKSGPEW